MKLALAGICLELFAIVLALLNIASTLDRKL